MAPQMRVSLLLIATILAKFSITAVLYITCECEFIVYFTFCKLSKQSSPEKLIDLLLPTSR